MAPFYPLAGGSPVVAGAGLAGDRRGEVEVLLSTEAKDHEAVVVFLGARVRFTPSRT